MCPFIREALTQAARPTASRCGRRGHLEHQPATHAHDCALILHAQLPALLESYSVSKVLIINDGRPGADAVLTDLLDEASLPYSTISVLKEPSTESVEEGVRSLCNASCVHTGRSYGYGGTEPCRR
jgi:hypothetical protein